MRSWQPLLLVALTGCRPNSDTVDSAQNVEASSTTPAETAPPAKPTSAEQQAEQQGATRCATTPEERTQELVSLIDQACQCEGDATCDEAASKRADAWNECFREPPDEASKAALWLSEEQIQTVFAETDRLKVCNDVVYRVLVATGD
jgi:hypothetical protein